MKTHTFRLVALLLAFTLLLTSCGRPAADSVSSSATDSLGSSVNDSIGSSAGDSNGSSVSAPVGSPAAEAVTMKLARIEGTVGVSDGDGKDVAPAENLGLYSGYGVITERNGYAWINLDSVKLTKMDVNSEIEITKDDKKLELYVLSGSLFFNITEPLADDETLNIRTSNMIVGIRGTCGWVEVPDETHMNLYLLEGTVECTVGDNTVTVSAGEMAAMSADSEIEVETFTSVPGFAWAEVRDDDDLAKTILETTGIDLTRENPLSAYAEVLHMSDVVYTEFIDFEADGSPELLTIYVTDNSDGIRVYRNEPDGPRWVWMGGGGHSNRVVTYSLVESDGKLFVRIYSDYIPGYGYYDEYYGSVAQNDGGQGDWGCVDHIQVSYNQNAVWMMPHKENGLIDFESGWADSNDAELSDVQGKYTHVRDLLIYDGTSVTIVEQ